MNRPILFSAPMVRAILDGRKTMTRRIYKPRFDKWQVGDRLWVRETYGEFCGEVFYRADKNQAEIYEYIFKICEARAKWRPSIFMPQKHSRILLEITELKRELLSYVNEADALREGLENKREFLDYFEKINPGIRWENPVVLAIGFKVLEVKK